MRQNRMSENIVSTFRRKLALIVGFGRINHHTGKSLAQTSWGDVDGNDGDDQKDKTRIYQHFGLKTKPPKGTRCLGICAGNRDNIVIISTDNNVPLEIQEGETLLYSEQNGKVSCHIHLGNNGELTITSEKARIKTDKISIVNSGGEELLTLLTQCLESIAKSKTMTSIGVQPLLPYSSDFPGLSQKIKSFLEDKNA